MKQFLENFTREFFPKLSKSCRCCKSIRRDRLENGGKNACEFYLGKILKWVFLLKQKPILRESLFPYFFSLFRNLKDGDGYLCKALIWLGDWQLVGRDRNLFLEWSHFHLHLIHLSKLFSFRETVQKKWDLIETF